MYHITITMNVKSSFYTWVICVCVCVCGVSCCQTEHILSYTCNYNLNHTLTETSQLNVNKLTMLPVNTLSAKHSQKSLVHI